MRKQSISTRRTAAAAAGVSKRVLQMQGAVHPFLSPVGLDRGSGSVAEPMIRGR
jgi:hypothetical protein